MIPLASRAAEIATLSARAVLALLRISRDPARLSGAIRKVRGTVQGGGIRALVDAVRDRAGTQRAYRDWIARFELPRLQRAAPRADGPLVTVLLLGDRHAPASAISRSLDSLRQQLHARWEVCSAGPAVDESDRIRGDGESSFSSALERSHGEVLVPLRVGDVLGPTALLDFINALGADSDAGAAYADFDHLTPDGTRHSPCFKPGWDPELLGWPEYLGISAAFRARAAADRKSSGIADMATRVGRARRIPFVLYHASASSSVAARAERPPGVQPPVSAIIPTRDGGQTLRRCVEGLRYTTGYTALELIVVDNGSRDPQTLSLLRELSASGRARVLRDERPFNYSALNNAAAAVAGGDVLLLLNDDVEPLRPGWVDEMVAFAVRPEVGAVGAQLLYPDGTIQHAGIVTGLFGVVGHVNRGVRPASAWPCDYPRTVSAVTGAALAIRRDVYRELGGLDEELAVAFNDVDLCLRAERAGYRSVYTPRAVLLHHESRTRGRDDTPDKRARSARETLLLQRRWGPRLSDDPYYSPNLSLYSETAQLAWPPRS